MKILAFLLLILSSSAFAVDICKFEETWEFHETLKKKGIKPVRVSRNHKNFSSVEKQLIHKTVTSQSYLRHLAVKDSLHEFGDYFDGRTGTDAGEIEYYNFDGKQFILVHYWPGENEVGAYFMLNKNGSFKLVAEIGDSFISCK